MPGTTKNLRAQPARVFANYTLVRSTGSDLGLLDVDESSFTLVPRNAALGGGVDQPNESYGTNTYTSALDIGFDFNFNGTTYKRFIASTSGWMMLLDPAAASPAYTDMLSNVSDSSSILSTITVDSVLLAPWFDFFTNTSESMTSRSTGGSNNGPTSQKGLRVRSGLEPGYAELVNGRGFGLRYKLELRSTKGRCLIVRWNSYKLSNNAAIVLSFEVVLYENGTIEFRYAPKPVATQTNNTVESGATGIWIRGTDRFRDFSYGLGYRDDKRQAYRLGGVLANNSYTDSGKKYSCNLSVVGNWPSLNNLGCICTFSPPKNRRTVLPRRDVALIGQQTTLPQNIYVSKNVRKQQRPTYFDDRKSVVFGNTAIVDYPTTLQRFVFGTAGNSDAQELFSDFEVTASISRTSQLNAFSERQTTQHPAFSEDRINEGPMNDLSDPFFSGSAIEDFGLGFSQKLSTKTQVKVSLPVVANVTLLGSASTIHYYNKWTKMWNVPTKSTYQIGFAATTNDSGLPNGDIVFRREDLPTTKIYQDHKGFGPIGNLIASGTSYISEPQSLEYRTDRLGAILGDRYSKTILNNDQYAANDDESFSIPINQPFLIEKVVIELPFAAGNGWFADKTATIFPNELDFPNLDFGGPGVTVSLMNQISTGGRNTIRDLIATGTITHTLDDYAEISSLLYERQGVTLEGLFTMKGFRAFNAEPTVVISPNGSPGSYNVTGSALIKTVAQISNGVVASYARYYADVSAGINQNEGMKFFNSSELTANSPLVSSEPFLSSFPNPFGRSSGGRASGRSIFGREFASSQDITRQGRIKNPFYLTATMGGGSTSSYANIPTAISATLSSATNVFFGTVIPMLGHKASPYLVFPGDRLILAVSKSRPAFSGNAASEDERGAIQHDFQLITGSINITLYGSVIQNGAEYLGPMPQSLASDTLHEMTIGNDPVLDQFEVEYSETYTSGTYDDQINGKLISRFTKPNGTLAFVTGTFYGFSANGLPFSRGSRGRLFSKLAVRTTAPSPGVSEFDYSTSLAYNLQPYFEKAGNTRVNSASDDTERVYDSMMPAIEECFKRNGAQLCYYEDGFFINPGLISFNGNPENNKSMDLVWCLSYPYESRYANIPRQVGLKTSFDVSLSFGGGGGFQSIPPRTIESVELWNYGDEPSVPQTSQDYYGSPGIILNADYEATMTTQTRPLPENTYRHLFGFGDLNTVTFEEFTEIRNGTNHLVDSRKYSYDGTFTRACSPIVRGWKYGVYSALPSFSKAYFRQKSFGQLRDMLEQKLFTKFHNTRTGAADGVVTVQFLDSKGNKTNPENTWSQNLSIEATSSMPYFDGETRNRTPINTNVLNNSIFSLSQNQFGQTTI